MVLMPTFEQCWLVQSFPAGCKPSFWQPQTNEMIADGSVTNIAMQSSGGKVISLANFVVNNLSFNILLSYLPSPARGFLLTVSLGVKKWMCKKDMINHVIKNWMCKKCMINHVIKNWMCKKYMINHVIIIDGVWQRDQRELEPLRRRHREEGCGGRSHCGPSHQRWDENI